MSRLPAIFFGHGNRPRAAEAEGDPLRFRALVSARHRGHRDAVAAHDPRFRRLSARALRVLSIDETQPAAFHHALGQRLAPLRDEGVLVVGSGNLIHNLHAYAWGRHGVEPFDWAVRFEQLARELMLDGNHDPLIAYESLGRDALLSAPTPDHYLPILYVLGARHPGEPVRFPVEGIDGGSVSMLTVQVG